MGGAGDVQDEKGVKVYGGNNLAEAAMSIDEQFKAITDKFGLPKEAPPKPKGYQSLMDTHPAMRGKSQGSVMKKAAERLSKPKGGQQPKIKKEKKGGDLLFDDGPASSGYGTNESTASTAKNGNTPGAGNVGDLMDMFLNDKDDGGDEFDPDFFKSRSDNKILEDAMAGNNLLGMVEEAKPRFGDAEVREIARKYEESGSALMDFFVDPTALFASERHPALQEVLKVLSRSKQHRGIIFRISTCVYCELSPFQMYCTQNRDQNLHGLAWGDEKKD